MKGWTKPIYYADGHTGMADELAASIVYRFGAKLQPWTQEEIEMARGRPAGSKNKPKDGEASTQVSKLAAALGFIAVAGTKDNDHCILADNFAVMFDGQLAAGHPIDEAFNCCPHLEKLLYAFAKMDGEMTLTELDSGRLSIKAGKARAIVPCLTHDQVFGVAPDPNIAPISDVLKEAFKACGSLASENAEDMIAASLLLEGNICTGTNKAVILQFWHGVNLPPAMVIPKIFTAAVCKVKSPLVGFGWTENTSITFWFEDGSWLKTLLYADKWPDVSGIMDSHMQYTAVPEGLFEGVAFIREYTDDDTVLFMDGKVQSHVSEEAGAQYEVAGLPEGKHMHCENMKQVASLCEQVDLTSYADKVGFIGCGGMARGVVRALI